MIDTELLAKCGWLEARGDGSDGTRGVMHVVMNRVHSLEFPNTVYGVIYQKNAFSWTRPTDPQYGLQPSPIDAVWASCLQIAPYVLDRSYYDTSGGALYYANLLLIDPAGWFWRNIIARPDLHPITVKIKHHTFFR